MKSDAQQFCLLLDGLFAPVPHPGPKGGRTFGVPDAAPSGHPVLPVPPEPCTLDWAPDRGVRLVPGVAPDPHPNHADGGNPNSSPPPATCVLEPVWRDSSARLAVLASSNCTAPWINGSPAPRVSLVGEGDQILLPGGVVLHVTLHHTPYIGPALEEHVGQECLICRSPFTSASVIYACVCGHGMHHEEEPAPGATEPLQCAATSSRCLFCRRPVILQEGFSYVPCVSEHR